MKKADRTKDQNQTKTETTRHDYSEGLEYMGGKPI